MAYDGNNPEIKKFYNSKAWKQTRQAKGDSVYWICERCGNPGNIVHHKTHLDGTNVHDPEISLNLHNLELLCIECHNAEHFSVNDSRVVFDEFGNVVQVREQTARFIFVTGAPCSGKSTYIQAHANGSPVYRSEGFTTNRKAVARTRQRFIKQHLYDEGDVYVEVCKLTPSVTRNLTNFKEIKMSASLEECLYNLRRSQRKDKDNWETIIRSYF